MAERATRSAAEEGAGIVVLDVGGVLLEVDLDACPRRLAALLGREPGDVAAVLGGNGLYGRRDGIGLAGQALLAAYRDALNAPGLTLEQITDAYTASLGAVDLILGPIAAALSHAGRLVLASNTNAIHSAEVHQRLTAAGLHPDTPALLSHEVGVAKPHPRFYQLLRDLLPGPCTVFVDDRIENVTGADAAGLPTWHHTDPQATAALLAPLIYTRSPREAG